MTITITRPQTMSRRTRYGVIAAALAALAASTIGYLGVQATTDDPAETITTPAATDASTPIADWARAADVSGLSPASVNPTAGLDVSVQMAPWARTNGVSGLSPASVSPTS